jgi:hypothetical protein
MQAPVRIFEKLQEFGAKDVDNPAFQGAFNKNGRPIGRPFLFV